MQISRRDLIASTFGLALASSVKPAWAASAGDGSTGGITGAGSSFMAPVIKK